MNEYLKEHPEKAFLLFTKVYMYYNNTKTPWNSLTQEQKDNKKFKWACMKFFFLSKKPIDNKTIEHYIKTDTTELNEPGDTTNNKYKKLPSGMKSVDYVVYGWFPLRACDVKVLLNTVGIRMLHMVDN